MTRFLRSCSAALAVALTLGLVGCDSATPTFSSADARSAGAQVTLTVAPSSPVCENSFYAATASVSNLPSGVTVTQYRWYKNGQLMAGQTSSGIAGTTGSPGSFTHAVYAELSNGKERGDDITVTVLDSSECDPEEGGGGTVGWPTRPLP